MTQQKIQVEHPTHYNQGGIECIDAIECTLGDKAIGFAIGNVIKYVWRYEGKDGLYDLKKAQYYLDRAIKLKEKELAKRDHKSRK